jgi:protein ImuB
MLWLAVHLPLLSLEAFGASRPNGAGDRPVALVAEHHITAADALALRRGIKPGLKRATALALAADLLLGQADAQRDAQALLAVAHAALAFTPSVTLDDVAPGTVLLEVRASLRYFGGLKPLLRRLRAALAPLGHRLQIASAPTALGAALLARWRDGLAEGPHSTDLAALQSLLDGAPVWLLGPGREHWEALQDMGLRQLSDLRHLPRAGLARRFGAALLDDLDRALGQQADPRSWLVPSAVFESRLELHARADTAEQVLQGAAVLLARLVAWAQARHGRVAGFTLRMQHEPAGPPQGRIPQAAGRRHASDPRHCSSAARATELAVELAEPAADAEQLQLLLRERLLRLRLAAPTLELRLHCAALVRGAPPNGELFPTRQSENEGMTRLLERLRARLGDDHVQQIIPVADHRPERAGVLAPARKLPAAAQPAVPSPLPLHRPVWLLPEPLPLAEQRWLPRLGDSALQLLLGPERIESGWWDGGLATRDYFVADAGGGALVWIYRERLPGSEAAGAGWYLHGRFG